MPLGERMYGLKRKVGVACHNGELEIETGGSGKRNILAQVIIMKQRGVCLCSHQNRCQGEESR